MRAPLPASWDGDEVTAIEYVGPERSFAAPRAYYGGDCYWRRTVHINRWGERVVRRVRVCD